MQMCVGARKQLLLLLSRSLCMIEARIDVRDYWWPSEDDWALIFLLRIEGRRLGGEWIQVTGCVIGGGGKRGGT